MLTNYCMYDCAYCVNRRSNDVQRTAFSPEELINLTTLDHEAAVVHAVPPVMAATRQHTPAVLSQPTNLTSQQIYKVADLILEREKVK